MQQKMNELINFCMAIVLKFDYKHAQVSYVLPGSSNCQGHQYSGVFSTWHKTSVKLRNDISIEFNVVDFFKSHIMREATVLTADIFQLNLGKIKYSFSLWVRKGNPTWNVYAPLSSLRRAWHHTVKSQPLDCAETINH